MAENTLLSYKRGLKKLFAWFRQRGVASLSTVSELKLNPYPFWLEWGDFSAATISRATASIRAFFVYEVAGGRYLTSPAEGLRCMRQERRDPYIPEEKEIQSFLRKTEGNNAEQFHDRAMLGLFCTTGLRASELISLKTGDVNVQLGYVWQQSKGRERVVSSDEELRQILYPHLKSGRSLLLKAAGEGHFFFNLSSDAPSRQSIWKIICAYGQKVSTAGEVTPQPLKDSRAVHRTLRKGRAAKQRAVKARSGGER